VRQRGGIVVVIAHRQSALAGVDLVLAMVNGRMNMMGPRDEVMARLFGPDQKRATPSASADASGERPAAKVVSEARG
jgi:ATP-binding cassette subfamily C protein